jgi:hypothetical protein
LSEVGLGPYSLAAQPVTVRVTWDANVGAASHLVLRVGAGAGCITVAALI